MKYLLDTNHVNYFLNGKFNLKDKIKEVGLINCAISELTIAELFYGAEKRAYPEKNKKTINDFIEKKSFLFLMQYKSMEKKKHG